ncbi:MAG: hypothetical protein FWF26_01370, partial [Treponema sp.]|nr:hypothetical protein [Treponema sp.]
MRSKNMWKIIKYPVPFLFITLIVLSFVISDCSNSLMEKIINSETTVHTGQEIAKYEIAISPSGNKFFGSVLENYTEPEPYIVTVVNTGNRNTGDIHVTISDADSGSFKLSASVIPGIDPGKSDFFSIVPKTGLALGVHTAAVTLTGDNGITAGLNVSINISAVPLVDIPDTDITIKAPVTAEVPDISVTDSAYFSISEQSWDPPDNPFKANKVYTAHVTLTANPGYTFTEETAIQINETTVSVTDFDKSVMDINITGVQLMVTYIFPKTVPLVIDSADITVTAPVTGDTPDATAKGTGNFKIGAVTWNPSDNPFTNSVNYTATVTLTANDNYSFEKLSSATINGNSAAIIENTGDELTLSYEFPKTLPVIIDSVDITISDPATGYAPNTMATGSGDFTIGAVTWNPSDNPFTNNVNYTATVTLTANDNYSFEKLSSATING